MSVFGEIYSIFHLGDIFAIFHLGDIRDISGVRGHLVTLLTSHHLLVEVISPFSTPMVLSHLRDT